MKYALTFLLVTFAMMFKPSRARAADYGDRSCNIFVSWASNYSGGDSRYDILIKVSRDLIKRDFRQNKVGILDGAGQFIEAKLIKEEEGYSTFEARRWPGAQYRSESFSFIALITNGIDSLYDNNSADNMIVLERSNNWVFRGGICR